MAYTRECISGMSDSDRDKVKDMFTDFISGALDYETLAGYFQTNFKNTTANKNNQLGDKLFMSKFENLISSKSSSRLQEIANQWE